MEHKYFEISQQQKESLDIAFSQQGLSEGDAIKLTTLTLNVEEASYIMSAIERWLIGKAE